MTSTNNNWEVVGSGKSGKKKQNTVESNNKLTKNQMKKFMENLPRISDAAPINEDRTIFEAFLEKERRQEEKQKQGEKMNGHEAAQTIHEPKKKNVPSNKNKKPQEKKKGPASFKDVANEVTSKELKSLLETVRNKFPETPSIWLKDMASYLNVKLNADISDPVFASEPPGFPLISLPSGIPGLLKSTIQQCSQQTLQLFFDHCLTSMVQDANKNFPTFGFRIFLQCLAKEKPEIVLNNLNKLTELRNMCQNRQQVCLSILWAAGQVGLSDVKAGLKVWLELLFPIISMRAFAKYSNEYLELLFKQHSDFKFAPDILGVREFFPIFDFIQTPLGGPHQKQLASLYPKLKLLAFGPNPELVMRNFFPSFLTRLNSSVSQPMKQELLHNLVFCLSQDKQSYSVWRQLYTKHLTQSNALLIHLHQNFDLLPSNFPRKMLKETLNTFHVTNEEIIGQKSGIEGLLDCHKACNDLLSKMSGWRFPFKFFFFFIFCSLSALLFYDINLHGSFKASKVGRYLKDYGLIAIWDQAYSKIALYSQKTYKYLEKMVPVYYSKVCRLIGPYLQLFWDNLFLLGTYLWDFSQPIRHWLNINIPPILQRVNDNFPKLWSDLSSNLSTLSEFIQSYLLIIWTFCLKSLNSSALWFQEHIFTGEFSSKRLSSLAQGIITGMQEYSKSVYQWLIKAVSNI